MVCKIPTVTTKIYYFFKQKKKKIYIISNKTHWNEEQNSLCFQLLSVPKYLSIQVSNNAHRQIKNTMANN